MGKLSHSLYVTTCLFCLLICPSLSAQYKNDAPISESSDKKNFLDLCAFRTNAFEWLATIPNVGAEFDLSRSEYNKMTIGLTAKYNWNTFHHLNPACVYDIFDVRPEFRLYYRDTQRKPKNPSDTAKLGFRKWFKDKIWTTARNHPHPWRAQYVGLYTNFSNYAFKFGPEGRQGKSAGLGVTFGYGIPLYEYNTGAIDLDLGLALGLQATTYDAFSHSPNDHTYSKIESKSRGWHLTPFPVLSEIRVSFVWRKVSIKDKYNKSDPQIKQYNYNLVDIEKAFETRINKKSFDALYSNEKDKFAANDSLYMSRFLTFIEEETSYLSVKVKGPDSESYERKLKKVILNKKKKAIREFKEAIRSRGTIEIKEERDEKL